MSGHPYKFGAHPYKVAYRRALGNASGGFGAIGVGSARLSAPSACRVRKRWWAVRTVSRTGRVSGVSVVCSQDLVRSKAERMAEVNGPSSTLVTRRLEHLCLSQNTREYGPFLGGSICNRQWRD